MQRQEHADDSVPWRRAQTARQQIHRTSHTRQVDDQQGLHRERLAQESHRRSDQEQVKQVDLREELAFESLRQTRLVEVEQQLSESDMLGQVDQGQERGRGHDGGLECHDAEERDDWGA